MTTASYLTTTSLEDVFTSTTTANITLLEEIVISDSHDYQKEELNLYYAVCEVVVATLAVVGNALVILVFRKERRLRRRTNYYIVSLAVADFLVGLLGIPFAILASVGLPNNLYACLFTVSLLVVLCTISIFCLVAVSVDRYWAILHPMGYSRNVRTKTALVIISICWFAGTIIGFLPLMGWHKGPSDNVRCFFLGVMDYNYLVFLYFGTIITPALLLAVFYAHIYHVVLKQLRQIVTINPYNGNSSSSGGSGNIRAPNSTGTMLRVLGAAQKREVKATQNLSIIVLFFMICWIPLYTINCILAFCRDCKVNSTFVLSCIILSHLNSAGNPLLYAYHLKDFRAALKAFICNAFGIQSGQQAAVSMATAAAINNNCTHYRLQGMRETHSAASLSSHHARYNHHHRYVCESQLRARTLPLPGTTSLVGNSVTLAAAAAAGEGGARDIWRISELSADDLRRRSITSSNGECSNDEVFLPAICAAAAAIVPLQAQLATGDNVGVYVVEHNVGKFTSATASEEKQPEEAEGGKEDDEGGGKDEEHGGNDGGGGESSGLGGGNLTVTGDFIHSPAKKIKLSSPFKAVSGLLKHGSGKSAHTTPRRCSLNEDDGSERASRANNGYLAENHSYN